VRVEHEPDRLVGQVRGDLEQERRRCSTRPSSSASEGSVEGPQAFFVGLKAVGKGKAKGKAPNLHIELYNLRDDEAQTKDVSAQHPEIVAQLERLMREQRFPSEVFPIPVLDKK
jgi:hypothetical protein